MKRRTDMSPLKIIIFIFLALILLNVYNCSQTKKYKTRLEDVKFLTVKNDTLFYNTVANIDNIDLLYSAEYIDLLSSHHSPFRDGKDFQTLCDDYIHNRYQDYYGSNRRTGACKRIHEGIDFFVPKNTPVYPIGKIGIVTKVSHNPNFLVKAGCLRTQDPADSVLVEYGKIVKVLYPEGYSSLYAHLDKVDVEENQIVYSDTKLGETGVTGNLLRSGKASHLHMELRDKNGNSFDPKHRLYYNNSNFRKFINLLNFDDKHGDKG